MTSELEMNISKIEETHKFSFTTKRKVSLEIGKMPSDWRNFLSEDFLKPSTTGVLWSKHKVGKYIVAIDEYPNVTHGSMNMTMSVATYNVDNGCFENWHKIAERFYGTWFWVSKFVNYSDIPENPLIFEVNGVKVAFRFKEDHAGYLPAIQILSYSLDEINSIVEVHHKNKGSWMGLDHYPDKDVWEELWNQAMESYSMTPLWRHVLKEDL